MGNPAPFVLSERRHPHVGVDKVGVPVIRRRLAVFPFPPGERVARLTVVGKTGMFTRLRVTAGRISYLQRG